jgi:protein-S-isoprenylcysteine O-methyltransferase Ste14
MSAFCKRVRCVGKWAACNGDKDMPALVAIAPLAKLPHPRIEGVNVATEALEPYVMPAAVTILLCLFAVQSRGTARIGKIFGPLTMLWFAVIAVSVWAASCAILYRHAGLADIVAPNSRARGGLRVVTSG